MVRIRVTTKTKSTTRTFTGSPQAVTNRLKQEARKALQKQEQELRRLRNRI